jgi:uncharacterized protein YpmB
MIERRAKRISVLIFLFAVFIMLVVFSVSWVYKIYKEQTKFTEENTYSTVECSKYYFSINPGTVTYEGTTLSFDIKNTLGDELDTIIVESPYGQKEAKVQLSQGLSQPVVVDLQIDSWFIVYPKDCRNANFKNVSFEPR